MEARPIVSEPLKDLAARLSKKANVVAEMARDTDPNDEIERARLRGKAEGMRLAVSLVEELIPRTPVRGSEIHVQMSPPPTYEQGYAAGLAAGRNR